MPTMLKRSCTRTRRTCQLFSKAKSYVHLLELFEIQFPPISRGQCRSSAEVMLRLTPVGTTMAYSVRMLVMV
jgi:hypothetical protein